MGHHVGKALVGQGDGGMRRKSLGVIAVESDGRDALGQSHRHRLASQRPIHRARAARLQRFADRGIGQRRGKQQRAIAELAPEIAQDIVGHFGLWLEQLRQPVQVAQARRQAAVDFAEHESPATAKMHHARLQIIRAEIDECANGARLPDALGDHQLVQPVLEGGDIAVRRQMRCQHRHRR